ncbi:hypothetical protein PQG02_17845 [Nostoc sp. UHCC 0926]|uniref:hypothetical protein n=1 Tax=unclassified Nostoc TaxID=2593658 RepID=UPI00236181D8|nr:hypothetical protein [Nostoc sp. UHCC 0926]WDD30621.1 hypothetical protein PQG02_17845 [Nostoc sp. UHCC 0926]
MPRLTVPPNFIGTSGIDTLVAEESNASVAIGINILNPGVISTFSGNDSITGTGTGTATFSKLAGTGIGINNSGSLNAGSGSDTITGTGIGANFSKNSKGVIIGSIFGGGTAGGTGTGISNSGSFDAAEGNDIITGTGTGGGGASGGGITGKGGKGGTGTGISNSSSFDAGDGNDTITGTGTGGTGGKGAPIASTGNSTFFAQRGDGGTGIGIQNIKDATITTGLGNDTIMGSGDSLGVKATVYGIFNDGTIDTGDDHDILTGQATTIIGGTAYGIYGQGIIRTGDGNDKVTATSNIDKVQQKVTIGGGIRFELGTGDDYFKGFGSAIVDGGNGFDTLDVSAFKRSEVSVSGVISGNSLNPANITFNNNGNSITLSTTGFENFIFADSSLSYRSLT